MAQHYLLSAKSRTLSLKQIYQLSEEQAFLRFKAQRWGNPNDLTDVVCPHCGIRHHAYLQAVGMQILPPIFLRHHQHRFCLS